MLEEDASRRWHGEEGLGDKRKQGGFKTVPFILANDFCDRFATIGFNANLITYLTQQLHLPLVEASNTLNNFHGFSNLTPIIGGLVADSFAGRFWTIAAGSIIYQFGMVSLTVSALLPSLRPPPCSTGHAHASCARASASALVVLHLSLLCTSIGTGGTRPCVMAFGADQFELHGPCHGEKKRRWSFFNLYFFGVELAKCQYTDGLWAMMGLVCIWTGRYYKRRDSTRTGEEKENRQQHLRLPSPSPFSVAAGPSSLGLEFPSLILPIPA